VHKPKTGATALEITLNLGYVLKQHNNFPLYLRVGKSCNSRHRSQLSRQTIRLKATDIQSAVKMPQLADPENTTITDAARAS
jgi:hypothetical protein